MATLMKLVAKKLFIQKIKAFTEIAEGAGSM